MAWGVAQSLYRRWIDPAFFPTEASPFGTPIRVIVGYAVAWAGGGLITALALRITSTAVRWYHIALITLCWGGCGWIFWEFVTVQGVPIRNINFLRSLYYLYYSALFASYWFTGYLMAAVLMGLLMRHIDRAIRWYHAALVGGAWILARSATTTEAFRHFLFYGVDQRNAAIPWLSIDWLVFGLMFGAVGGGAMLITLFLSPWGREREDEQPRHGLLVLFKGGHAGALLSYLTLRMRRSRLSPLLVIAFMIAIGVGLALWLWRVIPVDQVTGRLTRTPVLWFMLGVMAVIPATMALASAHIASQLRDSGLTSVLRLTAVSDRELIWAYAIAALRSNPLVIGIALGLTPLLVLAMRYLAAAQLWRPPQTVPDEFLPATIGLAVLGQFGMLLFGTAIGVVLGLRWRNDMVLPGAAGLTFLLGLILAMLVVGSAPSIMAYPFKQHSLLAASVASAALPYLLMSDLLDSIALPH